MGLGIVNALASLYLGVGVQPRSREGSYSVVGCVSCCPPGDDNDGSSSDDGSDGCLCS